MKVTADVRNRILIHDGWNLYLWITQHFKNDCLKENVFFQMLQCPTKINKETYMDIVRINP